MGRTKLIHFEIVGILPSAEFQKCAFHAYSLYKQLPQIFSQPNLRPMFDLQWTEYLQKQRRLLGGKLWQIDSCVVVFKNGEVFGSEKELVLYCNVLYRFHSFEPWEFIARDKLLSYIRNNERTHVYFNISIDGVVVGTLLFQLFTDLAPMACINFLRLVNRPKKGFKGASIHRIVKSAWVQIGGYKLKHEKNCCENYIIPHDSRGVISMCNTGKHSRNSKQFFISLQKNSWMDYLYVAFGHLLHGEYILQKIEAVPTYHESPQVPVIIETCGVYTIETAPSKEDMEMYENFLAWSAERRYLNQGTHDDLSDMRDVDSVYSKALQKQGFYSLDMMDPEPVEEALEEEKKIEIDPTDFMV